MRSCGPTTFPILGPPGSHVKDARIPTTIKLIMFVLLLSIYAMAGIEIVFVIYENIRYIHILIHKYKNKILCAMHLKV